MKRYLPVLVATMMVLGTGLLHAHWSGRWSSSQGLAASAAKLTKVPMIVGDWEGRTVEIDRRQLERGGIVGCLSRRYTDRRTGAGVTILVVCGRPGPISVHTPEVCYGGGGYETISPRVKASVMPDGAAGPAEFWRVELQKTDSAVPDALEIYYAWNSGGRWLAPTGDPRFTFARSPALYKLYVIRQSNKSGDRPMADASTAFLRILLPKLRQALDLAS